MKVLTREGAHARLGRSSATITELARPFGISLPGMKKHVSVLEGAQLVTTEKVGRARRCRLSSRRLEEITEWIESYQQALEARFDRFEEVLERQKGAPR